MPVSAEYYAGGVPGGATQHPGQVLTVGFAMTAAGGNGGIMYDTIKLEIE